MTSRPLLCYQLLLLAITFNAALLAQNKPEISKLNNAIIFDLFLNYELTDKNGNNAVLMDYLPNSGNTSFRKIEMSSNYGGENESTSFTYNDNGMLQQIYYQKNDKYYVYDILYENEKPASVSIGGNKKITFTYSNDTLKTISREKSGGVLEYNFKHVPGEKKAFIKLIVIRDGKRLPSSSDYFVAWNDRYNLTSYNLDVYRATENTYAESGYLTTFVYFPNDTKKTATWEYVFDDRANWTERKFNTYTVKRTLQYR